MIRQHLALFLFALLLVSCQKAGTGQDGVNGSDGTLGSLGQDAYNRLKKVGDAKGDTADDIDINGDGKPDNLNRRSGESILDLLTRLFDEGVLSSGFFPSGLCASIGRSDANTKYVVALYLATLGRPPTDAELKKSVSLLDAGLTKRQLARSVLNTSEYIRKFLLVTFFRFLERNFTEGDAKFWLEYLKNNLQIMTAYKVIAESQEFYSLAGNSPAGWLKRIYGVLLLRMPVQADQDYWLPRIASVKIPQASDEIIKSQEALVMEITVFYDLYLGRAADGPGLEFWIGRIRGGWDLADVQAGILASDEFINKEVSILGLALSGSCQ